MTQTGGSQRKTNIYAQYSYRTFLIRAAPFLSVTTWTVAPQIYPFEQRVQKEWKLNNTLLSLKNAYNLLLVLQILHSFSMFMMPLTLFSITSHYATETKAKHHYLLPHLAKPAWWENSWLLTCSLWVWPDVGLAGNFWLPSPLRPRDPNWVGKGTGPGTPQQCGCSPERIYEGMDQLGRGHRCQRRIDNSQIDRQKWSVLMWIVEPEQKKKQEEEIWQTK